MSQDLNTVVEESRRRIREQGAELERLRGIVRDLKAQADAEATSRVAKQLRSAQADLDRADAALTKLKREYAQFRLREALGQDPAFVETDLFDAELLALTAEGAARARAPDPKHGRIGFDTVRSLLLADLPLGQLIENERAERKSGVILDMLDERASTKSVLRQWAAMAQSDPYVSGMLQRAAEETARFTRCLTQFTRGLETLRIHYELKQRKADRLAFTFETDRPTIRAEYDWENAERVCADEARHLYGAFLGLEEARDEMRALRDELNVEVRNLMAAFVPRYVAYGTRQSRARRERLGLGRLDAGRLCRYLSAEIERTDFLLPRGSGMEMAMPAIPRNIAEFRKTSSYARFRKSAQRARTTEAATVEDDRASEPV